MYDVVETINENPPVPTGFTGSLGAFGDRIELSWNSVAGAEGYIIYRVDNGRGELKEIARTKDPAYTDEGLPEGVTYVYAVKSLRGQGRTYGESGFSEILEAWTAQRNNPPGIPSKLDYRFYLGNPVLAWEPVVEAEGYNIYRWSGVREAFLLLGRSGDAAFMDTTFGEIPEGDRAFYIVQAFNGYGEGQATASLAVMKEESRSPTDERVLDGMEEREDDVVAPSSQRKTFTGEYHRTDYFDYEYTMAQFRAYYEREMEAFRDFQKKETSDFEAWKKQNQWP